MKSFREFCSADKTNECARNSRTAEMIYNYLMKSENRILMAEYADLSITPLSAVVDEILDIANSAESDFDLKSRKLHRMTIARMIGEALEDLGYVQDKRTRVLSKNKDCPFSTAFTYKLTDQGTEYIFKEIRTR